MVQYSAEEVSRFISEIKNPEKLLRGCRIFHKEEPRDLAYIIARKTILENPKSIYHVVAGAQVLLLIWNSLYIRFLPLKIRQSLEKDLMNAYETVRNDIALIEGEKLQSIELRDSNKADKVCTIFRCFQEHRSVGVTGASKTLHLINPDLFAMWDSEIRKNFHKLHSDKRHSVDQCYLEFLKQMQEIVKGLLQQRSALEIWRMYPLHETDPQLVETFSVASVEPLTKMIDECNYVRFKFGKDF
jgi:hypothetical protein